MSIIIDLSPEIEKQLAAMPEDERTHFVTDAIREKLGEDDDPDALAEPSGEESRSLSPEASAQLVASFDAPLTGPSAAVKAAIRQWKLLTGK